MLIRSLLFTAGLVLPAAAAHVDLVARQTPPAKQKFQAIVPRAPEPTAAPPPRWAALGMGSLFERDVSLGTNTCGYIDETSTFIALTCVSSSTCTNYGTYRDCCQGTGCFSSTNFATACYDGTASQCASSTVGRQTLCCTFTDYPNCITYRLDASATGYTVYDCDSTSFRGVATMYTGTSSASAAGPSPPSSSTSPFYSSSSGFRAPTPTPDPTSQSSGTPIGAIVGGAVGGVAVLALIAFFIWFIMHRKRQTKPPAAQEPPQMAQQGVYPSAPSSNAPGYDPRYSYATGAGTSAPMSPVSAGYPSPSPTSPAPFANNAAAMGIYNQHSGHESWQHKQGNEGYVNPQHTGPTAMKDPAGARETTKHISEVDSVNPVGTGNHHAELA